MSSTQVKTGRPPSDLTQRLGRELYHDPHVVEIREKLGINVRDLRLAQLVDGEQGKPAAHIKGIKETVSVSSSLLKVKVLDTVLRGAEYSGADVWRQFVNTVDMTDTEKVEWPTITPNDFVVKEGYHDGAGREYSGGQFGTVSLDVSKENTIRYMHCGIKYQDIKFKRWGVIEEVLRAAGDAFSYYMLKTIVKQIQTDAGTTQAFDTDLYKTVLYLRRNAQRNGFDFDKFIVGPGPNADLMNIQKFIDANQLDRQGRNVAKGQIGELFAPVFLVKWNGVDTDITNILAVETAKAQVLGLAEDMTIREVDDTVLNGLHHAVITMQFDLKKGFANANGKGALA